MKPRNDKAVTLAQFADGPNELEHALENLDEAALDTRVSPRGWTVRQVVHHIVDGDDLWKLGIKSVLGSDQAEFTLEWYWAFPQTVWAERWRYASRPIEQSVALFRANRNHVLQLLEHVPDAWERSIAVRTPDGTIEQISVGAVVEMQANHAVHHIKQILATRSDHAGA